MRSLPRSLGYVAAAILPGLVSGCALVPDDAAEQSSEVNACAEVGPSFRFAHGTDGHADPLGARAASQARAGRIRRASDIAQPLDARHKVRASDFVLANDKLAVYIEAEGVSDGYFPFGGEILAIEPLDADGRPAGVSHYGETALMFGLQTVAPDRVSVLADGSDGGAAIVRASGVLKTIPTLDAFTPFLPDHFEFPIALDYVLEPGASKVTMRVSVANTRGTLVDFTEKQNLGVFQSARSQTFVPGSGFGEPHGDLPFIAWDNGPSSFLLQSPLGPMSQFLSVSGLEIFRTPPLKLAACEKKTVDYFELTAGGPGVDGLLEAKRKTYGEPASREVRGVVREAGGAGLAGALVHATSGKGYLTRATTDARGAFVLHVPDGPFELTPTVKGWAVPAPRKVATDETNLDLVVPRRATLEITTVDAASNKPLPVRVQVIPDEGSLTAPETFGIRGETNGRLYQEYVMDGHVTLPVPPGGHRVIVTRGYEYEVFDAPVTAEEGRTTKVNVALTRSVDSSGVMCADFHIHSIYSVDSVDPVEKKVRGAIADGLEIPVSSEHEYVIDFQPVIDKLGMGAWAFGVASEELTSFNFGHFGVFPLTVKPEAVNNGAIDWSWQKAPEIFAGIAQRPEHPMVIVNHPRGDSGYFELTKFDRKTATGLAKDLYSDEFGAIEVFNDSDFEANRDGSVADWFAFLNAGKSRVGVGSSDSHELSKSPVGYPRTCLTFGHDDPKRLRPETVRDVLRAGTAVVSGGLSMSVEGPNRVLPGGRSTAGQYRVVVASPGWIAADTLEVIVDGVTTKTITLDPSAAGPGPGKRHEVLVDVAEVASRARHWVVFHAKGKGDLAPLHPGRKPFAVSNPIFF